MQLVGIRRTSKGKDYVFLLFQQIVSDFWKKKPLKIANKQNESNILLIFLPLTLILTNCSKPQRGSASFFFFNNSYN